MKSMHLRTVILFLGYGMLLHLLASFFLVKQTAILQQTSEQLPLEFVARFGAFWFISFILALIIFSLYLRYKRVTITLSQKSHIKRLSKTATLTALVSILFSALFLYITW